MIFFFLTYVSIYDGKIYLCIYDGIMYLSIYDEKLYFTIVNKGMTQEMKLFILINDKRKFIFICIQLKNNA